MATKRLIDERDLIEWLDSIDLENMHRVLNGKKAKWLDTKGVRHMIATVPEVKAYTAHEVAEILAEFCGDDCACNYNGIDEWLPDHCELLDACPDTVGVACWEQYLKFRDRRNDNA